MTYDFMSNEIILAKVTKKTILDKQKLKELLADLPCKTG